VLGHEFVEHVPDGLDERTLYVSLKFATVIHKCCCGCGREVVTPLSPTDWQLTFDGISISLYSSIGNWNLPCQSHYWIERSKVKWDRLWSRAEIDAGRSGEARAKMDYYGPDSSRVQAPSLTSASLPSRTTSIAGTGGATPKDTLWQKLKKWLLRA